MLLNLYRLAQVIKGLEANLMLNLWAHCKPMSKVGSLLSLKSLLSHSASAARKFVPNHVTMRAT